ncbi:hypothetical protein NQZ68_026155 [Dissostichus eleginoides]|nr:hypothetical protein NQZ68_026155 [Dissostichus eleginoides]
MTRKRIYVNSQKIEETGKVLGNRKDGVGEGGGGKRLRKRGEEEEEWGASTTIFLPPQMVRRLQSALHSAVRFVPATKCPKHRSVPSQNKPNRTTACVPLYASPASNHHHHHHLLLLLPDRLSVAMEP